MPWKEINYQDGRSVRDGNIYIPSGIEENNRNA